MRKFILYSFALLCFVQANAQPLKIVVKKDQEYKVETFMQSSNSSSDGKETFESSFDMTTTQVFKITDVTKQEIKVKSECKRIISNSKIMDQEEKYDSDKKDNEGRSAKILSKKIGQKKNIVLDLTGNVIKEDEPEKSEDPEMDMDWMNYDPAIPLFLPELLKQELKAGDSIPVIKSHFKEKPSTDFSLNKESIAVADTGFFKVTSIVDGIASISYTGTETVTMVMIMQERPVNNISNHAIKIDLQLDMNTGVVISSTSTDEMMKKPGSADSFSMDMKSVTTTKVTRL